MLKKAMHDYQMQHTSCKHSIYTKQNGTQGKYFQSGTVVQAMFMKECGIMT